eukprot:TRINITY_DN1580_c0_g1_i1.p1 TRINITY_DN1580_c0_g1~~TRINITY_DN1580_c0_g1_i1.p1  ORF type:complete len:535 (-),score=68.54 TRINITY_DN1580_c0_g1_i1:7-1611(-)
MCSPTRCWYGKERRWHVPHASLAINEQPIQINSARQKTMEPALARLRRQVKHKDGDTRGISRAFTEKWDSDGSGELSKREFLQGLKAYGVLVDDLTEAEKRELWQAFDPAGTGAIDLHSFLMVLGDVYAYRQRLINEAFDKLDIDCSGEISIFEVRGRTDIVKYFDKLGNADGLISRMEWAAYCSTISSRCDSDEEFKRELEELVDIKTEELPVWQSISTDSPATLTSWLNKLHPNPSYVMGCVIENTFHVWCRQGKKSMIKGSWSYEYTYDKTFAHKLLYAGLEDQAPKSQQQNVKLVVNDPGTGVLLDMDSSGGGHILKMVTRPKRGARIWTGKLKYFHGSSLTQAEAFLNDLQPMPTNISGAMQGQELHLFVNDVGPTGYKYTICQGDIPYELIDSNQALVLGYTGSHCIYVEVPVIPSELHTTKVVATRPESTIKHKIRNPSIAEGSLTIQGVCDSEERLRALFDFIDVDKSGFITHGEMTQLYASLEKFGVETNGREALHEPMFRHSFLDQEKLSFDEFCIIMLKIAQW